MFFNAESPLKNKCDFITISKALFSDSDRAFYIFMNTELEIWKDVPCYEGHYQVSSFGNVKSLSRCIKRKPPKTGNYISKEKILKFGNRSGYLSCVLCINGVKKRISIHQLMAITFLGHNPSQSLLVVDHKNNIKTDNRLENLQIITIRENSNKDKKGKTSHFHGVSYQKSRKKWIVYIKIDGKSIYLGRHDCEIAASNAYQNELRKLTSNI